MTTTQFETWLREAIEQQQHDEGSGLRVESFEEAGVLTSDPGLVVRFDDGSEVQLTIVRSRIARNGSHPDESDE